MLTVNQPPPLPVKGESHTPASRRHDFFGAAALALGVICAAVTAGAIYLWLDVGQYRATEGAMAFSLHFYPWLASLCSMGIGVVTVVCLLTSYAQCRSARQPQLTVLHVGTALSLVPLLYLVLRLVGAFLR